MEKALLNVTRFNSADVIATSGEVKTCGHTTHAVATTRMNPPDEDSWDADRWDFINGKWQFGAKDYCELTPNQCVGFNVVSGGVYGYDANTGLYTPCSNDTIGVGGIG